MNTNKKNQHYVPQFYLKNFSNNRDQKSINLFNPAKDLFVKGAPIKNQSSKKYFYGKDGRVEEGLSQIENVLAPRLEEFEKSNLLPKMFSEEHFSILIFLIVSDLRHPLHIEQIKSIPKLTNLEVNNFCQGLNKNLIPEISHQDAIELSFSSYEMLLKVCLDLDYKILINNTEYPFITSDFPIIKYNQFLEQKPIYGSITGYTTVGVQIFVPINPSKCLLFYDSNIYKVGDKKKYSINLKRDDVDQLNILQILNCQQNIYFNQDISKSYIEQIFNKSQKFKKANIPKASSHGVLKENNIEDNKQIIHFRSTDLLINMSLSQVKLTRRANIIDLKNGIAPIRTKSKLILDQASQSSTP